MKDLDIVSPLDKALAHGDITPTEWLKRKREEIEKDVKETIGKGVAH